MENNPQIPSPYQGPDQYPSQTPPAYQPYSSPSQDQGYPPPPAYQPYPPSAQGQGYPPPPPPPMMGQRLGGQQQVRRRIGGNASGPAMMIRGAIMGVIGLVLTIGSHSLVSSSGGTYVVFTGLMVIGAIYFIIGLFRTLVSR